MVGGAGRLLAGVCLATGLLVVAHGARGESPPLRSIEPEAYSDQPAGIRYGSLLYHASLMSGMVWDSNIFASKENVVADRILVHSSRLDRQHAGSELQIHTPHHRRTISNTRSRRPRAAPTRKAELRGTIRMQRDSELLVGLVAARITEPRSSSSAAICPRMRPSPCRTTSIRPGWGCAEIYNPVISTTTVAVDNDNYFNVRSNRRHVDQPAISRP